MLISLETRKVVKYSIYILAYAVLIYAAFVFSYFIRFNTHLIPLFKDLPPFILYQKATFVIVTIWIILFLQSGFFEKPQTTPMDDLIIITKLVSIGTILVLAVNFFYRDYLYSRIVIALSWFFAILFLFLFHFPRRIYIFKCVITLFYHLNTFQQFNITNPARCTLSTRFFSKEFHEVL